MSRSGFFVSMVAIALAGCAPQPTAAELLESRIGGTFEAADCNRDRTLTYQEFANAYKNGTREYTQAEIRRYDGNGSGTITMQELYDGRQGDQTGFNVRANACGS